MSPKKRNQIKSAVNQPVKERTGNSLDSNQSDNQNNRHKIGLVKNLKKYWWALLIIGFISVGVVGGALKYLEEDAQRQVAADKGNLANNKAPNFLSELNPFLPNPTPTPQLSKEYIYAGSRMLAVEDARANAAPPADLAVWRPSSGTWYVMGPNGTIQASQQWGQAGDLAKPGDYDGDGKTDFCVFRPTDHKWYVLKSSTSTYYEVTFGANGDNPVPADFDGDGKTDIAVYRANNGNGTWYAVKSSDPNNYLIQQFGLSDDTPTPKDFDGDGKADLAVWRDGEATFYALKTSNAQLQAIAVGSPNSLPVPADYDGDGKADAAVWNGDDNQWHIRQSGNEELLDIELGSQSTDVPVQNDYDGDGKVDVAVWRFDSPVRSEIGNWYIRNSSTERIRIEHWGTTGDKPVPVFYRR